MELIRGVHNLRPRHRGCVATIGAFDGVHLGHQALLRQLLREAAERDLPSVVIFFEPMPREYLTPDQAPARLMSFRERVQALDGLGVDRALCVRFGEDVRTMTAGEFVGNVFVDGLGVKCLILGDDFRFGREREGDTRLLHREGERHGFVTLSTETFTVGGTRVSSTRLREALAEGDLAQAEALLGRPYSISGRVVRGQQLGRQMGAPTANVELKRLRVPLAGVFAVRVDGAGLQGAEAIANVGTRPTVDNGLQPNLEVHLLDRSCDLYGQRITVQFLHLLRREMKFASLEELQAKIHADIGEVRAWFAA